jgi:hypothetical protein
VSPPFRRRTAPLALALAALVACACGERAGPRPHATTAGLPDLAREEMARALEPRLPPRLWPMLRDSLRVVITPSTLIPAFHYHWGTWRPPGADTAYRALAVIAGGEAAAVRDAHEWSNAVGRVGWSPSSFHQAAFACAEAARAAGGAPRREAALYLNPRSLRGWAVRDTAAARRLRSPVVTHVGAVWNRWRAEVWMAEPGRAVRYRCLFTPHVGRRGPLVELARTDSLPGVGLPPHDD